jgi:hypothetical protein
VRIEWEGEGRRAKLLCALTLSHRSRWCIWGGRRECRRGFAGGSADFGGKSRCTALSPSPSHYSAAHPITSPADSGAPRPADHPQSSFIEGWLAVNDYKRVIEEHAVVHHFAATSRRWLPHPEACELLPARRELLDTNSLSRPRDTCNLVL